MNPTNTVAFIASIVVGFGVLYANPKRSINRAFFLLSVNVTAWILSLGRLTAVPEVPNPVLWLRITHAIASYIPLFLWIIKDCARRTNFDRTTVRKGWPWLVVAILMTSLCFTGYFIPEVSTREHPLRGTGWNVYVLVNGASYLILAFQAVRDMRSCVGIQKIELQTLLFGGTASGLVGVLLMALGPVFGIPALSRSIPLAIVAFYTITAWGITTQKIFDARHIFRSGLRFSLSLGIVAALIGLAIAVDPEFVPRPLI